MSEIISQVVPLWEQALSERPYTSFRMIEYLLGVGQICHEKEALVSWNIEQSGLYRLVMTLTITANYEASITMISQP
jgi:hypothetical protein